MFKERAVMSIQFAVMITIGVLVGVGMFLALIAIESVIPTEVFILVSYVYATYGILVFLKWLLFEPLTQFLVKFFMKGGEDD